jgi:diguanylate cyclase (GGDEF)-like protein
MAQPGAEIPEKRVLIVDDSKFVRTTFNRILSASFAVKECVDGEAGWQQIEADPSIVMVVSDLDMPKLDGYGLLERIRGSADARVKALPVIIISGNQNEAAKKRARDLGANDFVSKEADAPEVLSRIDNLLKLIRASSELEKNKQVIEQTATHDPLTGTFTPHTLMIEGRKHFSHARRHGGQISVMAFRIDSFPDVVKAAGRDVADQLLARIAKLVSGTLRQEDSIGRAAEATFVVISTGAGATQVMAFARRLYGQLAAAAVAYRGQPLRIVSSFGIASPQDTAGSIEELVKLALARMQKAAAAQGERIVGADEIAAVKPVAKPATLPGEIERAVAVLQQVNAERLGDQAAGEILRRLLPFLQGAFKRVKIDLPVDRIAALLNKPK